MRISPEGTLSITRRAGAGRDLDPTLGTTERDVHDGALVGHERGERHHLAFVNPRAETDATFGRHAVVAVLHAIRLDDRQLSFVVEDWIAHLVHAVALLDLLQEGGRKVGVSSGPVKEA